MRIITFEEQYRPDFIRLNTEWISTFFRLEESDYYTFQHIDSYILERGGQIFFALAQTEEGEEVAVGCCALIAHPGEEYYELAKMAVSPSAQGQGVGQLLGEALIEYARQQGIRCIRLEGNTRLAASIHLYGKLGFREIPLENHTYERCDILMELQLKV